MKIVCAEPKGEVVRYVQPFVYTPQNLDRLYAACSQFPVLFGRKLENKLDFLNHLVLENMSGDPEPAGLLWIVDDYVGMFLMDHITPVEADVHYSFFDRRHRGRELLVRTMMRHVFDQFGFERLNVQIPAYAGMGPRKFVEKCGFSIEGRKRRAAFWKGQQMDVYCYGILKGEI